MRKSWKGTVAFAAALCVFFAGVGAVENANAAQTRMTQNFVQSEGADWEPNSMQHANGVVLNMAGDTKENNTAIFMSTESVGTDALEVTIKTDVNWATNGYSIILSPGTGWGTTEQATGVQIVLGTANPPDNTALVPQVVVNGGAAIAGDWVGTTLAGDFTFRVTKLIEDENTGKFAFEVPSANYRFEFDAADSCLTSGNAHLGFVLSGVQNKSVTLYSLKEGGVSKALSKSDYMLVYATPRAFTTIADGTIFTQNASPINFATYQNQIYADDLQVEFFLPNYISHSVNGAGYVFYLLKSPSWSDPNLGAELDGGIQILIKKANDFMAGQLFSVQVLDAKTNAQYGASWYIQAGQYSGLDSFRITKLKDGESAGKFALVFNAAAGQTPTEILIDPADATALNGPCYLGAAIVKEDGQDNVLVLSSASWSEPALCDATITFSEGNVALKNTAVKINERDYTTNSRGEVALEDLREGETLTFSCEGFTLDKTSYTVTEDDVLTGSAAIAVTATKIVYDYTLRLAFVDKDGTAMANIAVKINGESYTTDANGLTTLSAPVHHGDTVTITAEGYTVEPVSFTVEESEATAQKVITKRIKVTSAGTTPGGDDENNGDNEENSEAKLTTGQIIGIVCGCVGVVAIGAAVAVVVRKKRQS